MFNFSKSSVPFYFVPIPAGQGEQESVTFMSTIDSFNPTFGSSWDESMDMGRADAKYRYASLSRGLDVSFKVVAVGGEKSTVEKNRDLINSLITMVYPVYKNGEGFNGVYVRMVVGDLFNEIGILTSVNPSPNDDTGYINGLPVVWKVDVSFTTLGKDKPKYKMDSAPLNGGYNNHHGVY